ncbi:MAG TPA: hypothetical protein VNS58_02995 [Puia sp.]|nr:hypothetical protein [Puia sp.]
MRLLRLLSRVAFICNICFLLASFVQWLPDPPEGGLVSMIIIMGYLLAILVNTVVNLWVIALFIAGRLRTSSVPVWLLIVNFAFFSLQLALLIINRK